MATYEDEGITIDDETLVIKGYRWRDRPRHIPLGSIRSIEVFEMGFWSGRHQLVGIPLGRPRSWFNWESSRRRKSTAIAIDVDGVVQPTITPDDPSTVAQLLSDAT